MPDRNRETSLEYLRATVSRMLRVKTMLVTQMCATLQRTSHAASERSKIERKFDIAVVVGEAARARTQQWIMMRNCHLCAFAAAATDF